MIFVYLLNILSFLTLSFQIKNFLHIYQLKDYNTIRFLKFFGFKWCVFLTISIVLFALNFAINSYIKILTSLLLILLAFAFNLTLISSHKTPLVRTPKIKRLFFISLALMFLFSLIPYSFIFLNLLLIMSPIISNGLNFYDKEKNKQFIISAKNKLKNSNTKVIAITGSNGKTSVKNILYKMLQSKYATQCTPSSYNTPIGISKFINNELKADTKYLILEYGARHINDVKDLCNLFGANYGIITCVNPQHLESFKTLENVKIAKGALSNFLQNKLCIFNLDNTPTYELFKEKKGLKIGISASAKSNLYAKNIKIVNGLTHFDIHFKSYTYHITTKLLGKHNVTNILLSSALALELGVEIEQIIIAIKKLEFTPHRLELIKTHINILDDSYNCSIESAREAIVVLNQFTGKKMIATPGIIEGGKNQYKLNYNLGKLCAFCDYCIIIGKTNKKAILEGLKSLNFNLENVFFCNSLEQAKSFFSLLNNNDTLLLLNDLPDDYH